MSTFTQISSPLHRLFISAGDNWTMRCDLHVHSIASGMFTVPGLDRICRESYNDPVEVYDRLKRLGMSIVTLTDHDSIDAAEVLRRHPDFFLSEEVTVRMPSGTEMHLGVYGMAERDHVEIQRRRNDFVSLLMYLTERKLFFSANHIFSGLTGRREEEDFRWFESYVPAFETRNGQMWPKANASAAQLAARQGKIGHCREATRTPSRASGALIRKCPVRARWMSFSRGCAPDGAAFTASMAAAASSPLDVFSIVRSLFADKPWTLALSPLAVLVPAFTVGHWLNEIRFCKKWSARMESSETRRRMLWDLDSSLETNLAG